MTGRRLTFLVAGVTLALTVGAAPVPAHDAAPADPRVTLFGDSVADSMTAEPTALRILRTGIDLDLEAAVCRRLTQVSCPDQGVRPPTVLDLVRAPEATPGQVAVVAVGYNDPEEQYPAAIEDVLSALREAGVDRVFWLTLRAVRHPYLTMNDAITAAAARHPELTVVDWNELSRTHPDWFAADELHLESVGARAMAALIRRSLADAGLVAATPALAFVGGPVPPGRVGTGYRFALRARGGEAPYRWKRAGGTLPRGVRLAPAGALTGVPAVSGRFALRLRVTDAVGSVAERQVTLSIGR